MNLTELEDPSDDEGLPGSHIGATNVIHSTIRTPVQGKIIKGKTRKLDEHTPTPYTEDLNTFL
jgi:hypothetical protein